jgi:hypothetical protein
LCAIDIRFLSIFQYVDFARVGGFVAHELSDKHGCGLCSRFADGTTIGWRVGRYLSGRIFSSYITG